MNKQLTQQEFETEINELEPEFEKIKRYYLLIRRLRYRLLQAKKILELADEYSKKLPPDLQNEFDEKWNSIWSLYDNYYANLVRNDSK